MPCDTIAVDDEKVRHWSQTVAYNRSGGYLHHETYLDVFGALHSFRAEFHFGVIARRKDFPRFRHAGYHREQYPRLSVGSRTEYGAYLLVVLDLAVGVFRAYNRHSDDSPAVRSALCDSAVVFVLLRFVAEQRAAEHCDPVGVFRKRSARIVR